MRTFLHIGPPKTGTSTLQNHVFPHLQNVRFMFWPPETDAPFLHRYLYSDKIYLSAQLLKSAQEDLSRLTETANADVLFSREHLLHHRFDKGEMLLRLRAVFGDVTILMFVRNQVSWVESSYLWDQQMLRRPWAGGIPPRSVNEYCSANWGNAFRGRFNSRFPSGDYGSIARSLIENFGRENVHVFVFEEMVDEPESFSNKLFTILGEDPKHGLQLLRGKHANPRISNAQRRFWLARSVFVPLGILRLLDPLWRRIDPLLANGSAARADLSPTWRQRISEHYAPGNRFLVDEVGLDLEKWGYPM